MWVWTVDLKFYQNKHIIWYIYSEEQQNIVFIIFRLKIELSYNETSGLMMTRFNYPYMCYYQYQGLKEQILFIPYLTCNSFFMLRNVKQDILFATFRILRAHVYTVYRITNLHNQRHAVSSDNLNFGGDHSSLRLQRLT